MTNKNKFNAVIVLAIVFGISLAGYFVVSKKENKKESRIEIASKYNKDNSKTFTSSVNYETPNHTQRLEVEITLKNEIISDVNTNLSKKGNDSNEYQTNFENSYKKLVIGKNIKDVKLSRVGGASITTKAFMEAITAVKNQL